MISSLFNTLIYKPLYNGLIFLVDVIPYGDVGLAVIILTVLVKLTLLPIAYKASIMQQKVREVAPDIEEIKKTIKDKQKQTLKILELYKEHNIKPFSSILIIIIQIPVILGLYLVFWKGGLPSVNSDILYSFVSMPLTSPNMLFLGYFDMGGKSFILALLTGVSQYFLSTLTLPSPPKKSQNPTLKEDMARSMHLQMKYVMPIIIAIVAYMISSAVALYWIVSNMFSVAQEVLIRRYLKNKNTQAKL